MRALRRFLLLLVPALLLAGCSARQGTPSAADPATRTTVRVENRSWSAVNVYVIRAGGSQRVRLGTVSAVTTQVLTIPRQMVAGVSTLQFLIDPIGSSRTPISQEIAVREGDELTLYVPNA